MQQVAVLFARHDSVYKTLAGCDVWDAARDALLWPGGCPVVAHPPCRAWGGLRHFAKPPAGEKELAIWAVQQVREHGGVLEHPRGSLLWDAADLPLPGVIDSYGGWTLAAPQFWWGHKCNKASWFYVVGCSPFEIPPMPFKLGEPTHVLETRKRAHRLPTLPKSQRDVTPPALAEWLLTLARKCNDNEHARTDFAGRTAEVSRHVAARDHRDAQLVEAT